MRLRLAVHLPPRALCLCIVLVLALGHAGPATASTVSAATPTRAEAHTFARSQPMLLRLRHSRQAADGGQRAPAQPSAASVKHRPSSARARQALSDLHKKAAAFGYWLARELRKPSWLEELLGLLPAGGDLEGAVTHARAEGLGQIAERYQRYLNVGLKRVQELNIRLLKESNPHVQADLQLIYQLAQAAAIADGARNQAEIDRFTAVNHQSIATAAKLYYVDKSVGRTGALLIARGVRTEKLVNAIQQLYRYGARIGEGSTMDALEAEVKAGCRRGGCAHFIKAVGYRRYLTEKVLSERLSPKEREIASYLVGRLNRSISLAGGSAR